MNQSSNSAASFSFNLLEELGIAPEATADFLTLVSTKTPTFGVCGITGTNDECAIIHTVFGLSKHTESIMFVGDGLSKSKVVIAYDGSNVERDINTVVQKESELTQAWNRLVSTSKTRQGTGA